jgi:uncharacterized membrane protein (DUF106 family)
VVMATLEEFNEVKMFGEMKEKLEQLENPWDQILTTFWSIIVEVYTLVIAKGKALDQEQIAWYQKKIQHIRLQEQEQQEDADLYLLNQLEDE